MYICAYADLDNKFFDLLEISQVSDCGYGDEALFDICMTAR